ncbi:helix-turn-helix domain-containing protein [Fusibacter tunisiensis]|jgi:hypothetical protein|uniref:Helix-turn-helix domain-containing protein n=1 Tax=Fusibacter tunisiensis TaxID=1008308 RepID=A0ABS2MPA7_9FIRM|nr:hypothetical protein [Fusibacter tunisiensis]MBM7561233.1 hypothetical protein [Fusibacter tunisiensis]
MEFWETIEREVFENTELDVYEKMCLLVLMSRDENAKLTSEALAKFMGCGKVTAKRAFDSLRLKGYLEKDYQSNPPKKYGSKVIRDQDRVDEITKVPDTFEDDFKPGFFTADSQASRSEILASDEDSETERLRDMAAYLLGDSSAPDAPVPVFKSQKEKNAAMVDQVIELVQEKISFKEANIILAISGNDFDKIKRAYQKAKASQVTDTIAYMIQVLQQPESYVIKSESTTNSDTQIDSNRLRKMQAYNNLTPKK